MEKQDLDTTTPVIDQLQQENAKLKVLLREKEIHCERNSAACRVWESAFDTVVRALADQ